MLVFTQESEKTTGGQSCPAESETVQELYVAVERGRFVSKAIRLCGHTSEPSYLGSALLYYIVNLTAQDKQHFILDMPPML